MLAGNAAVDIPVSKYRTRRDVTSRRLSASAWNYSGPVQWSVLSDDSVLPPSQTGFTAGPLNLLCGARNFDKIWTACGQHEAQYTELSMNR